MLASVSVAMSLLAHEASAQTGACDQLKATLAARIDPGIRAYTLETVPGNAPVPNGAKVIGTCEGGARKILFHRSGAVPAAAGAASAATLASPPLPTPQPEAPASAAQPEPPRPVVEPVATSVGASSVGEVQRVDERAVLAPEPTQRDAAPETATAPVSQRASALWARYGYWLAALALVVLGGSLWAWLAHRSAYDSAGLPRGPRLD